MVVLLAAMALAPAGVSAGWNQFGGDPARSGVAELPEAPLDVVSTFQLFEQGLIPGDALGLVDTPYGLTGLVVRPSNVTADVDASSQCTLFRLTDPLRGETETLETLPCENGGNMLGYDAVRDLLFLSIEGPFPDDLLRAIHAANGTQAWLMGPTLDAPATPGAQGQGEWWLNDLVIVEDEGLLYAAFGSDTGRHSIEAIDLGTQESIWNAHVPASGASNLDGITLVPDFGPSFFPANGMVSVTRTTTGIAVILEAFVPTRALLVSWFDLTGERIGTWDPATVFTDDSAEDRVSRSTGSGGQRATASANMAVASVGEQLVYIDPTSPGVQLVDLPVQGGTGGINWPAPLWVGEKAFVPTQLDAFIHDPDRGEFKQWGGFPGSSIGGAVGTPDGDVLVMIDVCCGSGTPDPLVRIDLEQARTVHALPVADLGDGRENIQLTPLSNPPGLLAWHDQTGRAALLAVADERLRPAMSLSTTYPAVGEPVRLEATAPDAQALQVGWGDGRRVQVAPGEATETTFDEEGLRTLRVTAVYEDGTTATAETVLHVGGTPPQDLNALQTAFARENQDLTFGVLGLLVALIGGLIAIGRRRRKRGILQTELDAIEQAYAMTREDPRACTEALAERRVHCRGLLLDGRLDEGQYAILEKRIEELSGKVRLGILDERFDYLPLGMVRRLEQMLADGQVSVWEREHFEQVLSQDGFLTEAQKGEVRALVDAWFSDDAGVAEA